MYILNEIVTYKPTNVWSYSTVQYIHWAFLFQYKLNLFKIKFIDFYTAVLQSEKKKLITQVQINNFKAGDKEKLGFQKVKCDAVKEMYIAKRYFAKCTWFFSKLG